MAARQVRPSPSPHALALLADSYRADPPCSTSSGLVLVVATALPFEQATQSSTVAPQTMSLEVEDRRVSGRLHKLVSDRIYWSLPLLDTS
jgi:hypothetical protein